ncbi:MAG TPA: hypothetical protein PLH75_13655 [Amaricoccus sp.]|uniref:hypothetical protein n=1 Tax=Amaricoccus sp. TaxID=1872485 RepID=UPI002CA6E65B|nr:hypothetical protein [Amaricoccus sp.]HPG23827.1 hypothetical protein [Amaricoccus sp.]HRW14014.1 hypothetical protein [Amaricoccus sp.]
MANVHYEETRPAGALPLRPTPTLALLALGILALLFAVATGEPPASAYKGIASQAPSAQMVIEDWRGNSAHLPVGN